MDVADALGRRRDVGVPGRDAAVPHRRLGLGATSALARGGTDVLVPDDRPGRRCSTPSREAGITNAFLVPAVLQMMCAVPGADDRDYSSLRSIAYGASPITTAALKRSLEVFRAPLFQVYGLDRDHRRDHRAVARPTTTRTARAQHLLRSAGQALPLGRDEGRRPGHRRGLRARARSARSGPARGRTPPGYWHKPGGDRGGVRRRRLAAHRRRGLPRRRGLRVPHRPDQGHDRHRARRTCTRSRSSTRSPSTPTSPTSP